ncbi:nucleoside monophosphate kinase [Candidatus Saccharibacteria bacterium]|nr:nucleoside monophosphate kinase [Candidatus Saccharibacteria bacterium]
MNGELTLAEKLVAIKDWLGTGSVNIFGLPMSGKDTVGVRLAEALGGKFLSSGLIIRAMEQANRRHLTDGGELIRTDLFYDWVLPYFDKEEIKDYPLILSSIGRWSGEEDRVLERAERSGHPIRAAVILNVSEADVEKRWKTVSSSLEASQARGLRADDKKSEVFQKRIDEFRNKTRPVLLRYRSLGLLVEVKADMDKDSVFIELVNRLFDFSQSA